MRFHNNRECLIYRRHDGMSAGGCWASAGCAGVQGVYYGVFPSARVDAQGRPIAVWVVSRPHNWHPKTTLEQLLEIDLATGTALQLYNVSHRTMLGPAALTHQQCQFRCLRQSQSPACAQETSCRLSSLTRASCMMRYGFVNSRHSMYS